MTRDGVTRIQREKLMRRLLLCVVVLFDGILLSVAANAQVAQEIRVNNSGFSFKSVTGEKIDLGGFSGMIPVSRDSLNRFFWIITDRGPNVDIFEFDSIDPATGQPVFLGPDGLPTTTPVSVGKGFPVPEYSPSILLIKLPFHGEGRVLSRTILRKPNGEPVTGLPNLLVPGTDLTEDGTLTDAAGNKLNVDPDGLDPEGITAGRHDGVFWISEEYAPSVCAVVSDKVVLRLVPKGTPLAGKKIPTVAILPAILKKRVSNRGLEGLAMAPNGLLYTGLQRPVANPDKKASEASANIRVFQIDLDAALRGKARSIRQFIYVTADVNKGNYISDLFALSNEALLASERRAAKIFKLDGIRSASDITSFEVQDEGDASFGQLKAPIEYDYTKVTTMPDGTTTSEIVHVKRTTIESLLPKGPDGRDELAMAGIVPLRKTLIIDLAGIVKADPNNGKFEGLCVNAGSLFLTMDNDFNLVDAIRPKPAAGETPAVPTLRNFNPTNYNRVFQFGSFPNPIAKLLRMDKGDHEGDENDDEDEDDERGEGDHRDRD